MKVTVPRSRLTERLIVNQNVVGCLLFLSVYYTLYPLAVWGITVKITARYKLWDKLSLGKTTQKSPELRKGDRLSNIREFESLGISSYRDIKYSLFFSQTSTYYTNGLFTLVPII